MRQIIAFLFAVAFSPMAVFAQEKPQVYDGRLEGYSHSVTLDGGGSALLWILLVVLAAIALVGLFKNARRTHLD